MKGQEVVRVAIADKMMAQGCVNCHNARHDTPKHDWKLGAAGEPKTGRYAYSNDFFGRENRLMFGFEVDAQRDDRKRFDNDDGIRGVKRFDQDENVTALGFYTATATAAFSSWWTSHDKANCENRNGQ